MGLCDWHKIGTEVGRETSYSNIRVQAEHQVRLDNSHESNSWAMTVSFGKNRKAEKTLVEVKMSKSNGQR